MVNVLSAQQAAKVLKALSHEHRLELYLRILDSQETAFEAKKDYKVCEIAEKLGIGAPTISHHLKELVNAGLIQTERQGKFVMARVEPTVLEQVCQLFKVRKGE
jgi:DNA-binding transcriptional ArsR family regulator